MRDKVVDGTALNSKWIPMALNGFFDSGDGPILSFNFAWGKVVVDSCLASCRMELALEILFWSSQEELLSCIGVVGDPSKTTVGLHESVELFACVVSTN